MGSFTSPVAGTLPRDLPLMSSSLPKWQPHHMKLAFESSSTGVHMHHKYGQVLLILETWHALRSGSQMHLAGRPHHASLDAETVLAQLVPMLVGPVQQPCGNAKDDAASQVVDVLEQDPCQAAALPQAASGMSSKVGRKQTMCKTSLRAMRYRLQYHWYLNPNEQMQVLS